MNFIYNENKNVRVCSQEESFRKEKSCGCEKPAEKPCHCNCNCGCEKPEPPKKCPEIVLEAKRLEGVKFDLIEKRSGCVIACGKTNYRGELEFSGIPFGCYSLRETESKEGYDFDDKTFDVDLSCKHPEKCVEVRNRMRQGAIKIVKIGEEEKFVMKDDGDDCGC
ncbi:hypothetical protein FACS1894211_14960 [Clostridia bacterium]|nr:hypothetical protein FACS1894211_14960 [Clostridia bacterium]